PGAAVECVEAPWLYWQKVTESLRNVLGDARRNLVSVDEIRRVFETFGKDRYDAGFYERRTEALAFLLVEKQVLSWPELEQRMAAIAARSGAEAAGR
ncbi:MAG: hypothetical protein Q7U14_14670, partial [Lacisediminimonas sp.]|nr:hypothetical protein [Lacisediminimonas sp.]